MGQPFTQKDLDRMGLVKGKDGVYAKPDIGNKKVEYPGGYRIMKGLPTIDSPQPKVKKGRPAHSEAPTVDAIEKGDGWCRITLAGLPPGLNGSLGLRNEHWAAGRKRRDEYVLRVKVLQPPQIKGRVRVTYTRYSSKFMDWDNACASVKNFLDSVKNNGVIEDDSPDFVVEFIPKQVRSRRKDQHIELFIEKL